MQYRKNHYWGYSKGTSVCIAVVVTVTALISKAESATLLATANYAPTNSQHGTVTTPGNSEKNREHDSVFGPGRFVALTLSQNGYMLTQDALTSQLQSEWNAVPAGSSLQVPSGVKLTIDSTGFDVHLLLVEGSLIFAPDKNTALEADTIAVAPSGYLEMGTAGSPISAAFTATVTFSADRIDTSRDPQLFTHGLLAHGTTSIYGTQKTWGADITAASVGGNTLTVSQIPADWKSGDTVLIFAADGNPSQVTSISGMNGNTITLQTALTASPVLDPLYGAYGVPLTGKVFNMARNIVFRSKDPTEGSQGPRGHVMFMHSDKASVNYASFVDLGRTDNTISTDNTRFDASGNVTHIGTNQIGRYPLHYHRVGKQDFSPMIAKGNVVIGAPGWGITRHSSNLDIIESVVYDTGGSGIASEFGDEVGQDKDNAVVKVAGSSIKFSPDIDAQGKQGSCIWLQANTVTVDGLYCSDAEFGVFTSATALDFRDSNVFRSDNPDDAPLVTAIKRDFPAIVDTNIVGGQSVDKVEAWKVPMRIQDVVATRISQAAIEPWRGGFRATAYRNTVSNALCHHMLGACMRPLYSTAGFTLDRIYAFGQLMPDYAPRLSNQQLAGTALDMSHHVIEGPLTLKNSIVVGWLGGLFTTLYNTVTLENVQFDVTGRHVIASTPHGNRTITTMNTTFGTYPLALRSRLGANYREAHVANNFAPNISDPESVITQKNDISVEGTDFLYTIQQEPTFVPFPTALAKVNTAYVGLTNQQLKDRFGVMVHGVMMPTNAVSDPRYVGFKVVSSGSVPPPPNIVPPSPSPELCIQIPLTHRTRNNRGQDIDTLVRVIEKSTGTEKIRTNSMSGTDGKVHLTDATLLANIKNDTTTLYDIFLKPEGHLEVSLLSAKSVLSGICLQAPAPAVGDFDEDNRIELTELVRTIPFYRGVADALLKTIFGGPIGLSEIVGMIRAYVSQ